MKKAIVAISKDEKDMDCWIDYHTTLGFDIFIYDDNDSAILNDKEKVRVYRNWKFYDLQQMQPSFYTEIVQNYGLFYDWILAIDCDEYVCYEGDLDEKLGGLTEFGGFCCNWLMFNSGGHEKRASGRVFDNYVYRMKEPWTLVKSFINPKYFLGMYNPHCCESSRRSMSSSGVLMPLCSGGRYNYKGCFSSVATENNVWINHYFTKSREDWLDKIERGYKDGHPKRNDDDWNTAHSSSVRDNRCSMLYRKLKKLL